MDRRDEIIRLQMDVINQMTRNNLNRIADDLWGVPSAPQVPSPSAETTDVPASPAGKAEEEKKAARLVKVKVKRRFRDMELNQIKDTGDVYTVSRERAAVLEEAGVAAVMAE